MKFSFFIMVLLFVPTLFAQKGECVIQAKEPFQVWVDGVLFSENFNKEVSIKNIEWSEVTVKINFENKALKPIKKKKVLLKLEEEVPFDKVNLEIQFSKKNKAKLIEVNREINQGNGRVYREGILRKDQ